MLRNHFRESTFYVALGIWPNQHWKLFSYLFSVYRLQLNRIKFIKLISLTECDSFRVFRRMRDNDLLMHEKAKPFKLNQNGFRRSYELKESRTFGFANDNF